MEHSIDPHVIDKGALSKGLRVGVVFRLPRSGSTGTGKGYFLVFPNRLGGHLDGPDDLCVARAPAQIEPEGANDVFSAGTRVVFQ